MALVKISTRVYNSFMQKCLINKSLNMGTFNLLAHSQLKPLAARKELKIFIPSQNISRNYAKSVQSVEDIRSRVFQIVHSYDKITPDKVKAESHFIQDLGLDSLDHVEIMMAMEDEFGFEIPDSDAEKLLRPDDIIKYISKRKNIEEDPLTENI